MNQGKGIIKSMRTRTSAVANRGEYVLEERSSTRLWKLSLSDSLPNGLDGVLIPSNLRYILA